MQTMSDKSNTGGVLERVKSWIWNRVALETGQRPMDIGEVDRAWDDEEPWHTCADDMESVHAVGPETTCHRYGGRQAILLETLGRRFQKARANAKDRRALARALRRGHGRAAPAKEQERRQGVPMLVLELWESWAQSQRMRAEVGQHGRAHER